MVAGKTETTQEKPLKIHKRPKDDSSDDEQMKQRQTTPKTKKQKSSPPPSITKPKVTNERIKSPKSKKVKSPKTPKTPKTPKKELKLNDEYDEKEREEMIGRRRDRRRAQRKADKEIEAQMDMQQQQQKMSKQKKKNNLAAKKFKIGDTVRVVNLNGVKVKYPGIIRWVGLLDEEQDANKFIKGSKNKIKKTFGIELLEHDGENDGSYDGKRYFSTKDGAKRGVFIKRIDFRKHHVGEPTKRKFEDAVKKKKGRRQRNDAQMYGNMFDNLWTERIDIMGGEGRVSHKLGPREVCLP